MNRNLFSWVLAFFIGGAALNLSAQGTAFLYQGSLNDGGSPATGVYDLAFALYDAPTNGVMIAGPQTNVATTITNGLFTATINFGNVFTGTNYWLAIAVRSTANVTNTYAVLWPRQPLLPVPYAVFANSASNLVGTLPTAQLAGTLTSSQLAGTYSSAVSFTNSGSSFAGNFTGNGSGLTNLNGSQITTGTVADARLSGNVALLNANQAFTGSNFFSNANSFTNRGNNFTGSFFGNGLVGWNNISDTAVQAQPDHGYLLLNSGLTTVTLPPTTNLLVNDIVRISGAGAGGWLALENTNQSIIGNFVSYHGSLLLPAAAGSDWRCIASSANGTVMYAGGGVNGTISISTDAGKTWNATGVSGNSWVAIACSADGTRVFAVPASGSIQYSLNSGTTWVSVPSSSAGWSAIACSADGTRLVAGNKSGSIYAFMNISNATPSQLIQLPSGNANWTGLAMSSDASKVVAVYSGGITRSSNGGTNWSSTALPGTYPTVAMSADGIKLAVAIAGNGITTTTNFGDTWTTTTAPTNVNWSSIAGSSDCARLVAGISNSVLYASANFGATWSPITTTNQAWSGVAVSDDGSKFAATISTIGSVNGSIYYSGTTAQSGVISTNSSIGGAQGSAVELQYIGNGQFMPVSSSGLIWAN